MKIKRICITKYLFIIFLFLTSAYCESVDFASRDFSGVSEADAWAHHEFEIILPSEAVPFDVDFTSVDLNPKSPATCFPISSIEFIPSDGGNIPKSKILRKFSFAHKIAKPYLNTCMNTTQINTLLNKLNKKSIAKGYITTKFGLLPQDLNKHIMKIGIEVGFIGDIEYVNNGRMLFFGKDFGTKIGDVLNLHTIELGIANLKRLRYLSTSTEITPMTKDSESKATIATEVKSLPVFIQASFDNGGNIKEGYEGTFLFGVENPMHLADSLQLYALSSLPTSKNDHSYYASLSYSIPIRRFLFQVDSAYAHNANQLTFYGISPVYSGYSVNADLKATYLAYTDAKNQLSFGLGFAGIFSDNYLENIKLDVQSRRLAEISAFVDYKRYVGNSRFDVGISLIQGIPVFAPAQNIDKKAYLYTIPSVNLYIYHPFSLWNNLFVYSSTIKTQISRDHLYASEKMTIGGRYSVRGFNHFSLSGQMGVLYRNDLAMYLPSFWGITLAPSLGVDMGYVRDILSDDENSGFLSGGGVGVVLFYKYLNAQVWDYLPFYNPYNVPTQNLFFSLGLNW